MDIDDFLALQPTMPKHSLNYMLAENIRKVLAREGTKVRKAAAAEGHAEGLAEGHAEGLAEGHAEGLAEGHAEGLAEGLAKGKATGEQLGLKRGKLEVLTALLCRRFAPLQESTLHSLNQANQEQLDTLALALLDASTLEEAMAKSGLNP